MAKMVDMALMVDLKEEVINFAQKIAEQDEMLEKLGRAYNINTIKEKHIKIFSEDLRKKGLDSKTAQRVAKNVAEEIIEKTMNEIQ